MDCRFYIPTRDGLERIKIFHPAYLDLGISPLYIVDSRTRDGSIDYLRAQGADFICCTPHGDYAETGMVEAGAVAAGTEWVFRIDDDEFPSRALVDWLSHAMLEGNVWSVPRREIHLHDGAFVYSRWPTRFSEKDGYLTSQLRLFRPRHVRFISGVHTPGVASDDVISTADQDCFITHFNCVLNDLNRRLEKARIYASYNAESWLLVDEALPELTPAHYHAYAVMDDLGEFDFVQRTLSRVPSAQHPALSKSELVWMRRLVKTARELRIDRGLERSMIDKVPAPLLRRCAELICSLGRLTYCQTVHDAGANLWNRAARRQNAFPILSFKKAKATSSFMQRPLS